MRTYTEQEVARLVLHLLQVLPEGETPPAASAELAESAVDSVHARLDGEGLLNWPCCAVPSSVVFAVAYLAAMELVEVFGVSTELAARISGGAERGSVDIRRQTTLGASGVTRAVYY